MSSSVQGRQGLSGRVATAVKLSALAAAYFGLAKAGLALASIHPSASPIWAPSGLALAAMLLWGWGMWPSIAVGAFLANLEASGLAAATAIAAGNTLEAYITARLVQRSAQGTSAFDSPWNVVRFVGLCLATGSLVSATIGVASLALTGQAGSAPVLGIWTTWWLGDIGGQLLVAPAIVLWMRTSPRQLEEFARSALLYGATVLVGLIAFSPMLEQTGARGPLAFLAIVPLLWAALVHGPRDTASAALILSAFAIWGTASGGGPFTRPDLNESFLLLLSFAISTAVPSLVLSADAAARRRTEVMLRSVNKRIDLRVKRRTAALADANRKLLKEIERRTRVEAQLLEAQRLADLGSWSWDVSSSRVVWSDQLFSIYGIAPEQFGGTFEDFLGRLHPADRPRIEAAVNEAYTAGHGFRHDERIIRPDGEVRYLHSTGEVIRDSQGTIAQMIGICQDITAQREAQAALETAQSQLAQAQKMESIGQLTGGIAHDFNNLLTVIIGNLERMLRWLEKPAHDSARLKEAAANALRGAQRGAALTRQLLAFSRRQALDPKAVDVNDLVASMSELLHRTLGERVVVKTDLAEDLWKARADPNQLEGALLNLAVNAKDAMPNGGTLAIETRNVEGEGFALELPEGQYVMIRMLDTGHGMTADVAARAFEPFFTTKDVGQGTGLGLSQVYGFAKQSGGHANIASVPGKGTTVTLLLPRASAQTEGAEQVDKSGSAATVVSSGETILVVEDDPDVRAHSVEIMRELGYRTLCASDAKEALAIMHREPAIAFLFSDIGLPGGMNGLRLAEEAIRLRPQLRVLLATGYARSAIADGERLPHGVGVITKPFEFNALAARLRGLRHKPASLRILVVEDEPLVRMSLVQDLEGMGFQVEEAASAECALKKADGVCAAIIDVGLPGMKGDALAVKLRACRAELPLIIASGHNEASIMNNMKLDQMMTFVGKPYNATQIETALRQLGLHNTKST